MKWIINKVVNTLYALLTYAFRVNGKIFEGIGLAYVKIERWRSTMMGDKKKPDMKLDLSDISAEKKEVPAPIDMGGTEEASVDVQVKKTIQPGFRLNGKLLKECTPEEIKDWAYNLIPHDSIDTISDDALKGIHAKEAFIKAVALGCGGNWLHTDNTKQPVKYHQ